MSFLRVKNWEKFQHYKDRNPPWIKLHASVLKDFDFRSLPDAAKAQLICLWVLASETNNKIPYDEVYIRGRCGTKSPSYINLLIEKGFLSSASAAQASFKQNVAPLDRVQRKSTEKEKETPPPAHLAVSGGWETFWKAYPKKLAKQEAMKAWKKLSPNNGQVKAILDGLSMWERSEQWNRERPRFIPYPATFLNQRRWEESPTEFIKQTERPKDPENCVKCGGKIEALGAWYCKACAVTATRAAQV